MIVTLIGSNATKLRGVARWFSLVPSLAILGCSGESGPVGQPDNPDWEVASIWNGDPPGDFVVPKEESRIVEVSDWREIVLIKNVSSPSVTIIKPPENQANGSAMVILPGGAFGALAWDVEGTEVGEFLADHGITAFLLRYRVRDPTVTMWLRLPFTGLLGAIEPGRAAAAEDAMQAMRFVRANAERYEIDPERIGMMGFSAGGITVLRVLKEADTDGRPDIAASIYGMMFDDGVQPESTPMFVAVARDDESIEQSEAIHALWQQAGAPSELHIFETGGHGFGLGRAGTESAKFAALLENWLREQRFIAEPPAPP